MERDKLIKIVVAAVIGLAAIVLLAVNFLGGPKPTVVEDETDQPLPAEERTGGGRMRPGAGG